MDHENEPQERDYFGEDYFGEMISRDTEEPLEYKDIGQADPHEEAFRETLDHLSEDDLAEPETQQMKYEEDEL